VQVAAINPKLHREIWLKYNGKLPPKDESIRFYLLREREAGTFNRAQVDGFIAQFRGTVAFAKLPGRDKIDDADAQNDQNEADEDTALPPSLENPKANLPLVNPPTPPKGLRDFPLYTSGPRGALYVPESMTRKDFELLKTQIENGLAVIEATSNWPDEQNTNK
jgi:hypothetical protein